MKRPKKDTETKGQPKESNTDAIDFKNELKQEGKEFMKESEIQGNSSNNKDIFDENQFNNSNSLNSTNINPTKKKLEQVENNYVHLDKIKVLTPLMQIHHKLDLHKRSITPTTLDKIVFEKSEEELYYKEYYKHKDNAVTRFAINYSNVKATELEKEGIQIIDTSQGKIKSVATTVYKDNKTKEIISNLLHPNLEKDLIQQAVNHLLDNKDVKTVLVDILERNLGSVVCDAGIPRIHTVVLYKNPTTTDKHEIVVIDPSSFFFSSHLSNKDIHGYIKHDFFDKILTRHEAIQIYTAPNKDNIGSKPHQWRECIDISVKLAFALNKAVKGFKIKLDEITKYEFVQLISNMDNIDKSIIASEIPSSSRIKQSSDISEVKKFKAYTETINKKQKIAFSFNKDLSKKIGDQYNDLLKCNQYDKLINDLLGLNQEITKVITDEIIQYDTQLTGSINIIDEA